MGDAVLVVLAMIARTRAFLSCDRISGNEFGDDGLAGIVKGLRPNTTLAQIT